MEIWTSTSASADASRTGNINMINQDATNTSSGFFQYSNDSWEIIEPPSNRSTGIHSEFEADGGIEYPWSSNVLSTSTVGSPVRFKVPPYTSFLQWYGTVGPDQGRYEFRLIPTGPSHQEENDNDDDGSGDGASEDGQPQPQFQPIPLNQSYTGQRPVDSIFETKVIAWLDPRWSYDAEIELVEDGKRTDLHGISFWRYTEMSVVVSPFLCSQVHMWSCLWVRGAEVQDWWTLPTGDTLSGGQIAGIVVSP